MSTIASPRPRRKVEFSAELLSATIAVNGATYAVEPIPPGEFGTAAFRLVKLGSDACYDVIRDHDGLVRCDCPAYVTTHEGTASTCKHGRALVALGLVEAPVMRRESAPVIPRESPVVHGTPEPVIHGASDAPTMVIPREYPAPVFEHPSQAIDFRTVPSIDGTGLTDDERRRVNGARRRAWEAYAKDADGASFAEVEAVAIRAASDELRRTLADRPATPAVPCCDPAETAAPCSACVSVAAPLTAVNSPAPDQADDDEPSRPAWDIECDPADWPADVDSWFWMPSPDPEPEIAAELPPLPSFASSSDDAEWAALDAGRSGRHARRRMPADVSRSAPIAGLSDYDHQAAGHAV